MAEFTAGDVGKLREMTGAGLMDCKKALTEAKGSMEAAVDLLRKKGVASAAKKSTRATKEGAIAQNIQAGARAGVLLEINCETDFVAREQDFRNFAADLARLTLAGRVVDVPALLAAELAAGESVDERRRALVAKIGENISVRRCVVLESSGVLGAYAHGSRIGALVAIQGGSAALAHDLAMHVAASNPRYISAGEVPPEVVAKEREILTEQARKQGKSPEILAKMVEGRLRKALNEIVLLGQPFVKDPDQSVEKLLKSAGATVLRFERFEVGAGIEKKPQDFVAEVMAQVSAAGGR